jgi:serine/threonine-protein kinase
MAIANAFAMVSFVQIFFALPRFRRAWYVAGCLYVALLFLGVGSAVEGAFHTIVQPLITITVNAYLLSVWVRALRTEQYRTDALISLIGFVPTIASMVQALVWAASGHNPMAGLHPFSIAILIGTCSQALVLGRRHASRQRTIEQTSVELRYQVAERSRELADALAKLSEHSSALLAEGEVIDNRYRVVRSLGSGGMGVVYEVERIGDSQRFALKRLRGRVNVNAMARFAREAQVAAELAHPNLVSVLDIGMADGSLYLVMELVHGQSLDAAHARYGDRKWAVPLLRQIATGLAAMHERGIVHRDLKPANVLVAEGTARIADFGLASLLGSAASTTATWRHAKVGAFDDTTPHSPQLTRMGDVFGTPIYMGPELAAGTNTATPASDMFSFGVLACELLTGKRPFVEPPVVTRLNGRSVVTPELADIDADLRVIITRCLHADPAQRPSAGAVLAVL